MMESMIDSREQLAERLSAVGQFLLRPSAELEKEYVRLFLSPNGAPCPPWQSVYEPNEGDTPTLCGKPHHSALEWYRRYGAEPQSETEPADHAGLLLLFYAQLVAAGEPEEVLALFRAQHLAWIPAFLTQVGAETTVDVFRQLAPEVIELLDTRV